MDIHWDELNKSITHLTWYRPAVGVSGEGEEEEEEEEEEVTF